jgi:selenocysteine lyase/cysteine desulfurase
MRTSFGDTFDVPPGYCNTASIGVPPTSIADEVTAEVRRWASGAAEPPSFDKAVGRARDGFAAVIGTTADRVAAGVTVSQMIGIVSANLPSASRILVQDNEFTSVTYPFVAGGHAVTVARPGELIGALAGHDLVAVSAVQSATGEVIDLDALREEAERAGTEVLIDVTQAAGWLPMSLAWADYVVGTAYKWLMAPRGAAWLAVAPERLGGLTPWHANWYAAGDRWDSVYGTTPDLPSTARRLDLSPVWFAQIGAAASLEWLLARDGKEIHAHDVGLANKLREGLGMPQSDSAIVSADIGDRMDRLVAAGVRVAGRAGRCRFAFHLYNTDDDVELALRALASG